MGKLSNDTKETLPDFQKFPFVSRSQLTKIHKRLIRAFYLIWQRLLYFPPDPRSKCIIGPGGLNYRVRDGNGVAPPVTLPESWFRRSGNTLTLKNRKNQVEVNGIELMTSWLQTRRLPLATIIPHAGACVESNHRPRALIVGARSNHLSL